MDSSWGKLAEFKKTSRGVKAITLEAGDRVAFAEALEADARHLNIRKDTERPQSEKPQEGSKGAEGHTGITDLL